MMAECDQCAKRAYCLAVRAGASGFPAFLEYSFWCRLAQPWCVRQRIDARCRRLVRHGPAQGNLIGAGSLADTSVFIGLIGQVRRCCWVI